VNERFNEGVAPVNGFDGVATGGRKTVAVQNARVLVGINDENARR
jgi:hypothetical protein